MNMKIGMTILLIALGLALLLIPIAFLVIIIDVVKGWKK